MTSTTLADAASSHYFCGLLKLCILRNFKAERVSYLGLVRFSSYALRSAYFNVT